MTDAEFLIYGRIGMRLRKRRQVQGYTLAALSVKCRVPYRRLSDCETARHRATLADVVAIARALHMFPSEVFGENFE